MAVQSHPRSLVSVPIESGYATSYSSIATLVISCPFQRYYRLAAEKSDPTPIPPDYEGVPQDQIADVVPPRSGDPKLIIRVITFELTQHICHGISTSQADGRMDGQRDGKTTYDLRNTEYLRQFLIDFNHIYRHSSVPEKTSPCFFQAFQLKRFQSTAPWRLFLSLCAYHGAGNPSTASHQHTLA